MKEPSSACLESDNEGLQVNGRGVISRTLSSRATFDRLVLVIYVVLLFEGALRKWVFPDAMDLLFFVRDPLVIAAYIYALSTFGLELKSSTLKFGIALIVMGGVAGAINVWEGRLDVSIYAYGFRNYFVYLPLVYLIGQRLSYQGWCAITKVTVWLQAPLAILCIYQLEMPALHPINAGVMEGGLYQPGVFGEVIRTYGTFTSSAGQTVFITFSLAVLLWCLTLPRSRRPLSTRMLVLGAAGALSMLAVSGSRGAYVGVAFVCVVTGLAVTLLRHDKMQVVGVVAAFVFAVTLASLTVFSKASDALYERVAGADESEVFQLGFAGRIIDGFTHFVDFVPIVPALGFGVGTFGNANSLKAQSQSLLPYGANPEDDWSRNICDLGPVIGLGYLLWRCLLVAGLMRSGFRMLHADGDLLPLILASFCVLTVVAGQITGQGSVHGFGFLGAGFALASTTWRYPRVSRPTASPVRLTARAARPIARQTHDQPTTTAG
jgi:hypothetical protein